MSTRPKDGYVFIVTYGRSGSTVIQSVLQSIDGYFIRGENNNTLMHLYEAYKAAHEARHVHGAAPLAANQPWYGADEIRPEAFADRLMNVFRDTVLRVPQGTRVAGFKEIRFHRAGEEGFDAFLDFMRAHLAPARFIFNMRGWEAVSRSSWWRTMDPADVRARVEMCDRLFTTYAAKHPDCCYVTRYEDLAGKPEAFEGLFRFLGEPFDLAKVSRVAGQRLDHAKDLGDRQAP